MLNWKEKMKTTRKNVSTQFYLSKKLKQSWTCYSRKKSKLSQFTKENHEYKKNNTQMLELEKNQKKKTFIYSQKTSWRNFVFAIFLFSFTFFIQFLLLPPTHFFFLSQNSPQLWVKTERKKSLKSLSHMIFELSCLV